MMKRLLNLLFALALAPLVFAQSYSAILTGAAEVPGPGDPDGTGFAVVTVSGTTLTYAVWVQGIGAPTGAHIHTGAAGVAGDVLVPLDVNQLGNGSTTVSQTVANQITANPAGFYVNVHNAEFTGGALRGQLVAPPAGEGAMAVYLPVVSKAKGASNTNFVTDLRVVNVGASTATVTLDYYGSNPAGLTAPSVTKTVTVDPGEQKVLDDVVNVTLGVTSGFGGLKISSTRDIIATARVVNDLRDQGLGTAGLLMPAVEAGKTSSTIAFLAQNVDYRTNIGWFNYSATPVTVTFTARRSSDGAALGATTVTIPGGAMVQQGVFALISSVPEVDRTQSNFYVSWTSTAPILIYGAMTDNRSGDAVVNQ